MFKRELTLAGSFLLWNKQSRGKKEEERVLPSLPWSMKKISFDQIGKLTLTKMYLLFIVVLTNYGGQKAAHLQRRLQMSSFLWRFPWNQMKQISEIEENPLTSSLTIYPKACGRKGWVGRSDASPLITTIFLSKKPWIYPLKTT